MKHGNFIFTVLLLIFFGAGCATTIQGRKIDPAEVKKLEMGRTKADQIKKIFGPPEKIEKLASGEEVYVYRFCRERPILFHADEVDEQELKIIIRDDEVARAYVFRTEEQDPVMKQ